MTTETAMANPKADTHRHHQEITIDATHQEDTLRVTQKEGHFHHQQIKETHCHERHILNMIRNQHAPTHRNHRHILHHRQQGDFTIHTKKRNEVFRPRDLTMSHSLSVILWPGLPRQLVRFFGLQMDTELTAKTVSQTFISNVTLSNTAKADRKHKRLRNKRHFLF